MLRRAILALLPALATTGMAAATTMEFDGQPRTFEMYVPPTAPRPLPIVLLLHGGRATAEQMRRYTAFDDLATREDILAVYPQGIGGQWNDGRPQVGTLNARAADSDDVKFLLELIDTLVERGLADAKRVYAAGISNGGMMALRLACEHPERLAAVAVVAANQPEALDCHPAVPVPIIFFHGTNDRFMPYGGGQILQWANLDRGKVLSATDSVGTWRKINGCTGQPKRTRLSDTSSTRNQLLSIERVTYKPCAGAPVIRYIARGGGHAWPGAKQGPGGDAILGPADVGLDANQVIWDFFKAQPERQQ